jgi:hypothetical protein
LLQLAQKAIGESRKDGWAWWYEGIADDGLGRKTDAVTAYPLMTGYTKSAHAQELAAEQLASSSKCPVNEHLGPFGHCYPNLGITVMGTQMETTGHPD